MSRYIDFYLIGELVDAHGNVHYEDLKNLPSADVVPMEFHERCMELEIKKRANMVEVVRCKDCVYYENFLCGRFSAYGNSVEEPEFDYCSYGEPKSESLRFYKKAKEWADAFQKGLEDGMKEDSIGDMWSIDPREIEEDYIFKWEDVNKDDKG